MSSTGLDARTRKDDGLTTGRRKTGIFTPESAAGTITRFG
jgi:hypothetical protein